MKDSLFINCAKEIVATARKPEDFVEYLIDALNNATDLEDDKNDPHFTFLILTQKVAIPWVRQGKDYINQMADGLANLYDFCGSTEFQATLGGILRANSIGFNDLIFEPAALLKKQNGINSCFSIAKCFFEVDEEDQAKIKTGK